MKNNNRVKYIDLNKDKDLSNNGKPVKKPVRRLTNRQRTGHVLSVIGTTFLTLFLIIVITICIVAVALTVYVMQFAESSFDIDLHDVELNYTSMVKAYDKNGDEVDIKQLSADQNRIWVDIEDMSPYLIDAVVATEDKRFFEHEGVDWTRTVKVVIDALIDSGTQGASTITQQLVRDVTKDNKVNAGRKLREIFRALSLEQKYNKFDILESYLNRIWFGRTCYGVGSAARHYFDKDVKDLTIAESAILAGLIRSPGNINPYANSENARRYQKNTLGFMYENGMIDTLEYEAALNEQVWFRLPIEGDYFGYIDERYNEYYGIQDETSENEDLYYEDLEWDEVLEEVPYKWNGDYEVTQNWYVDAAINQVVADLAEIKGVSNETARDMVYNGGYNIFINVDLEMQEILSKKFEDPYLCLKSYDPTAKKADLLQAAFVIMDYRGNVRAIAGGIGEKEGDNCFNRATQAIRPIGSTTKPLSVYSLAVEMNLITYSTMIRDISGEIIEDPSNPEVLKRWPYNYQETFPGSGNYWPAWYAVQKSLNTIAARVIDMVGLQNSYIQMTGRLGFTTYDSVNDISWSPLAFGALTNGAKLVELAAAYQIFGNGGVYYEPYFYSKVTDNTGKIILEQDNAGIQAISSDTAWITNRMMRKVIEDPYGSGQYASLPNVEVVGKTGTTNNEANLLFCGLSPEYIGVYSIGYDGNKVIPPGVWKSPAAVWHDVMVDIVDTETVSNFTPDSGVVEIEYCANTGLLATSKCPNKVVGYYKLTFLPQSCDDTTHTSKYWETHGDEAGYIPFYKT